MPLQLLSRNDTHEFKPLLTEIEERPISPFGRLTFWLLLAVIVFMTAWAIIGELDIVITARGKVIPDGHVKMLQPLDTGVVSSILVKEGDYVRKGQVLMEIDPSITQPELEASRRQLQLNRIEMARLRATLDGNRFMSSEKGSGSSGTQSELYESSTAAFDRQLAAKDKELERVAAQLKAAMVEKVQNEDHLIIAVEKEKRLSQVLDLIPKADYETVKNEITTLNSQIEQGLHKLVELTHQKNQISHEREKIRHDFRTTNLEQLVERQKQWTELEAKEDELTFKHRKQRLVSPANGYVDKLFVHTVGGVVSPAEKLISIVPDNTPLVVDLDVSNNDIGFVKNGLPTSIKVDTFDFQKYGMMEGTVKLISQDSHEDEKTKEQVYDVYITPTKSELVVDSKKEHLSSGMTVTSEIKVGKRRIIEFFIYPLIKNLHNGLSVR